MGVHSSEIGGLCLMKWPSEILQNLPYFMYKNTHVVFFVFQFVQLYTFTYWMPWSLISEEWNQSFYFKKNRTEQRTHIIYCTSLFFYWLWFFARFLRLMFKPFYYKKLIGNKSEGQNFFSDWFNEKKAVAQISRMSDQI